MHALLLFWFAPVSHYEVAFLHQRGTRTAERNEAFGLYRSLDYSNANRPFLSCSCADGLTCHDDGASFIKILEFNCGQVQGLEVRS
jgi:hypothetical protein